MLPRTLGTRVATLAGLLALAGVSALSFILIRSQQRQIEQEVILDTDNIAETIRLSIRHDMLTKTRDGVQDVIESVARQPRIAAIRIYDKEGMIQYSSQPEEVGELVDKKAEACVQCHDAATPFAQLSVDERSRSYRDREGRTLLATIKVIPNEEGCHSAACHRPLREQKVLGVLDVSVDTAGPRGRLLAATTKAVLISLGAVVAISASLFLVVRHSVRRPVRRMIRATRRVAAGDFHGQLPSNNRDEIGFLARSFNEMIESLSSSQLRVEEWVENLESNVAEKARQLREAQFQVLQAEKLSSVGLVAAGIAHELNSPLMAIVTFAHMVMKKLPPDSQEHQDMQMILRETDRCAAIIRNLLDFSRDQEGGPETEPCEVGRLLERCVDLLRVEIKNHEIDVSRDVEPDLPLVEGNAVQMQQVFVNLLLNAVQAMPDGGELALAADVVEREVYERLRLPLHGDERLVRVRVRDTGPGIPADALGKVFDPFFTTKPVGQGSGLGLSVSHGIISRFRGTILVESDGRTGTEFTVLLPAMESIENDERRQELDRTPAGAGRG